MPHNDAEMLPTRASLLERMKDWRDKSSWQNFFDTYWKLIYGVARKGDLTDAEAQDVVQEVLVHVAKQIPTFRYDPAIGSFKGWLLTKTRWCIIEHLRRRARVAFRRGELGSTATEADAIQQVVDTSIKPVEDSLDDAWAKNLYEAALVNIKRRIDPHKLQIFDFYVRKEWPAEEVAARLGVSVDQVYLAKHRVSDAIKEEVARLEREMT